MSENVRVTSIARKISRSWFWRLFWILFWVNIALLVVSLAGYCVSQEHVILGHEWIPGLKRSLDVSPFVQGDLGQNIRGFVDSVTHADYIFHAPDGISHSLSLTPFFDYARSVGMFLLGFEALILLGQAIAGPRRARKLLEPLDRMARAARRLTQTARYTPPPAAEVDDQKLHSLQDAIGRISPDHPEQKLHMGDQDLAGLEDAINSLLSRMHDAYRQQAQFVSDASHELRTPIAVIQGYAGMLDRWGKQDEKILDESITAIKNEASYMNRLIEQLLFLARGDTGRQHMEFARLDLAELAKELYEDSQLIDKSHDWRIEADAPVNCTGDRDMLKQCARILAENARKYTPEGGVIHLRAYTDAENRPCLQVQDSGMGISGADAPHVFDRFYRSDPARSRRSGGTGLGLSIACWIAESHSGHIDLLSREGIGTRMTLCLPPVQKSE